MYTMRETYSYTNGQSHRAGDSFHQLSATEIEDSAPQQFLTHSSLDHERVVLKHLPVVRSIARRIHRNLPNHVEIDDLVSAGLVGLMEAAAKFDATKNISFTGYIQFRVRGAILDSLRSVDWAPRELRRKGRSVQSAIRNLTSLLGRAPSEEEVATELKISLGAYQKLLGDLKSLEIGSLHQERGEDSGDEELDYVAGPDNEDPLFRCMRGELANRLTQAIEDLPEQERLVITLYHYEELTRNEISLLLGIDGTRVSQIRASAVLHLRSALLDLSCRVEAKLTPIRCNDAKKPQRAALTKVAA